MITGKQTSIYIAFKALYNTCRIHPITHICTVTAQVAVQSAKLLIRILHHRVRHQCTDLQISGILASGATEEEEEKKASDG